jgi:cell wall-associated NlpC family hydrolase
MAKQMIRANDTSRVAKRRALRRLTAAAALVVVLAAPCVAPSPAGATGKVKVLVAGKTPTTLPELQRAAAGVRRQIRRLDERLEIAVERYNAGRARLDAIDADLTQARLQLSATEAELQRLQERLAERVAQMYKMGDYGWLEILLDAGDLSDAETQVSFFRLIREQDRLEQQQLQSLTAEVQAIETKIADRREEALEVQAELDADRALIEQQLAERQRILDGLDGRIKAILARQARLEAAEAARLARLAGIDLRSIHGGKAQIAAVRYCMRFLGVPYVWGGADPTGFDCSGLVMCVFARFGVVLPHYAASQAAMGVPVPFDRLQPGDLVFFGSPVPQGIHHVGMYVGNGLFIEAPHTGDVVKVSVLAGRGMTAARRYPLVLP